MDAFRPSSGPEWPSEAIEVIYKLAVLPDPLMHLTFGMDAVSEVQNDVCHWTSASGVVICRLSHVQTRIKA